MYDLQKLRRVAAGSPSIGKRANRNMESLHSRELRCPLGFESRYRFKYENLQVTWWKRMVALSNKQAICQCSSVNTDELWEPCASSTRTNFWRISWLKVQNSTVKGAYEIQIPKKLKLLKLASEVTYIFPVSGKDKLRITSSPMSWRERERLSIRVLEALMVHCTVVVTWGCPWNGRPFEAMWQQMGWGEQRPGRVTADDAILNLLHFLMPFTSGSLSLAAEEAPRWYVLPTLVETPRIADLCSSPCTGHGILGAELWIAYLRLLSWVLWQVDWSVAPGRRTGVGAWW